MDVVVVEVVVLVDTDGVVVVVLVSGVGSPPGGVQPTTTATRPSRIENR